MLKKLAVLLGGRTGGLVACVIEIAVGILLLINPVGFTTGIIVAAGILTFALGVVQLVKYFRQPVQVAGQNLSLMKGLLLMLAGGFCALNSEWFMAAFPVLSVLYGLMMLAGGVVKLQWMTDLLRLRHPRWYMPGISALLYILIAVIVIVNPFSAAMAVWMFVGISMIVSAVVDGASLLMAQ